ncbi:hypothetical protein Moror_2796 [Moniliophthora roreri MCA 2997]|uniref:Filamentation protein n=2 Tax=Moniliophthora roreri TaxID=221103 RepID=V2WWU9_MONRO|nr:hypothetical protein Moror_2796 [Moniliophthora roreri MCA 2997]
MSNVKERHYWTQLRTALTAGQWSSLFPAKAPNGTALSWSELFRKFNKHCKGFSDVAEVASQTHALSLLLSANSRNEDQDQPVKPHEYPLELGEECVLPEERVEEAKAGYETLKRLESSNFDTLNFALAYYAYALGNPSECLSQLNKVPDVSHVQNHIPLPKTMRASTLNVPTGGAGSISSASSGGGSFVSDSASMAEIKDGRSWAMVETIRSLCLQGMATERLRSDKPQKALDIYAAAFPILTIIESELVSVPPTAMGKIDFSSFTRFREVWRWVERLLWRAIVLASKTFNIHHDHKQTPCKQHDSLWTWLDHYSSCSVYWPSEFRTSHRSTISVLYLRALVLRYRSTPALAQTSMTESPKPPAWMHTARLVVQEYRAILSKSTKFPRAGERNYKVEDFVDLCVAVWEASGGIGDYTGWVLDVLWWATRLTFNSYRILRHMTHLLYVSGDTSLARRTLRLYVQVVGKAFQASGAGASADADTDEKWVETLVFGIRMFCKTASALLSSAVHNREELDDLREAGSLVAKAKGRLNRDNKELTGSVELAEGIWNTVMALREHDPHTRPEHLTTAHSLFLKSLETYPSPSAHYHLALSYARPGPQQDISQAIIHAGSAVEGDPKEIRYWHLLGLLSAASELWEAAQGALEAGAMIGETPRAENGSNIEGTPSVKLLSLPDINMRDYANPPNASGKENGQVDGLPSTGLDHSLFVAPAPTEGDLPPISILSKDATAIPPADELLQPPSDHPPPTRHESFEHALQLRMTQIAVTEYVEGVEGAASKLPEVFQWIAEKRGVTGDQTRNSIDGTMSADMKLKSPSELALNVSSHGHDKPAHEGTEVAAAPPANQAPQATLQPPIPITISPATPTEQEKGEDALGLSIEKSESGKRSQEGRDPSKPKKVQQMLKNHVHKGSARISTISKKIGHGVVRNGSLRRSNSTPDFSGLLRSNSYQASSIHSRKRVSSFLIPSESVLGESPPPPTPPALPPTLQHSKWNNRSSRENRLLSDLWLMSAATFRRLGKIEQAKGAIQEAEVRDESNPNVWVQLGLYYIALGQRQHAVDSFQKALFISPDDIAASIHLSRIYIFPQETSKHAKAIPDNVDLAAGLLAHLTDGPAWDVPEAWYFLAKAYGMQGRPERERECLSRALTLSERRGVRDINLSLGWCL